MSIERKPRAPEGDLRTFAAEEFSRDGVRHRIFRKGSGPAVIVITELPGISPMVLGFADRVIALGCTAVLPHLFGVAGGDPLAGSKLQAAGMVRTLAQVCVSREFTTLALGRSSPVTRWLRALAAHEHERCGGPGVGVVGMCFTGGFALAMAVDPVVVAPVLSSPSLPLPVTRSRRRSIDCGAAEIDVVARRCATQGLRVLGLRFVDDPLVPAERFAFLRERLGDGFVAVELPQSDGHPDGPLPHRHSMLTADLVDEPGEPTRAALDRVLNLFATRLALPGATGLANPPRG